MLDSGTLEQNTTGKHSASSASQKKTTKCQHHARARKRKRKRTHERRRVVRIELEDLDGGHDVGGVQLQHRLRQTLDLVLVELDDATGHRVDAAAVPQKKEEMRKCTFTRWGGHTGAATASAQRVASATYISRAISAYNMQNHE